MGIHVEKLFQIAKPRNEEAHKKWLEQHAKRKCIIIVHVYDQENSQAYPLGGVFQSHEAAERYVQDHYQEVKNDHWTANRVDEEGRYSEEFTDTGWEAKDMDSGASLEIEIHYVEEIV